MTPGTALGGYSDAPGIVKFFTQPLTVALTFKGPAIIDDERSRIQALNRVLVAQHIQQSFEASSSAPRLSPN